MERLVGLGSEVGFELPSDDTSCRSLVRVLLKGEARANLRRELQRELRGCPGPQLLYLLALAVEEASKEREEQEGEVVGQGRVHEPEKRPAEEECGGLYPLLWQRTLEVEEASPRLLQIVAGQFDWNSVGSLLETILRPQLLSDDEAFLEEEGPDAAAVTLRIQCLTRACQILRGVLSASSDLALHQLLARHVLPIFLGLVQSQTRIAPLRIRLALPMLHLFFQHPAAVSSDQIASLWLTIKHASPVLGLALLCRVLESLQNAQRLGAWLRTDDFWIYLYGRFEECVRNKSTPLSVWKQALFVLRAAIGACAEDKELQSLTSDWISWQKRDAKAILKDWDMYQLLMTSLEESSLHMVEPVWPKFEEIALAKRVPKVWLQLVYRRALQHGTIHIVRMALIFLFQSAPESLWWMDDSFIVGHLLEAALLPVLYRGVSGQVFPDLVFAFWSRIVSARRSSLIPAMLPLLFASNPTLHHNVSAVQVLLRTLSDSAIECLDEVAQASSILLLGRSHYCIVDAWRLLVALVRPSLSSSGISLDALVAALQPHALEIVRDCPLLAREFSAKIHMVERCQDGSISCHAAAIGIFCANGRNNDAARLMALTTDRSSTMEALLWLCSEDMDVCQRLLGPWQPLLSVACEFCLSFTAGSLTLESKWRLDVLDPLTTAAAQRAENDQVSLLVSALRWARHLTMPWFVSKYSAACAEAEAVANSCVPFLCRSELISDIRDGGQRALCSSLVWVCLDQISQWLPGCRETVSEFACSAIANPDWQLEFSSLSHVFSCCQKGSNSFAEAGTDDLFDFLLVRFEEIASALSEREAPTVLQSWAQVALGEAAWQMGLVPKCLRLMMDLENRHHRFQGSTATAVERFCVPRWKKCASAAWGPDKIQFLVEELVLLAVQGFERDDSRRLDKVADLEAPKAAFALSRAFVAAFFSETPPSPIMALLAALFVRRLFGDAVAAKERIEKACKSPDRRATQFTGSAAHLENVRVWQVACIAVAQMSVDSVEIARIVDGIVSDCIILLDALHLQSVVIYIENFLLEFLRLHPRCIESLLLSDKVGLGNFWFRSAHMKILIGVAMILVRKRLVGPDLCRRIVHATLPFLNAVQHPVRYRCVFCCVSWAGDEDLMRLLSEADRGMVHVAANFFHSCGDLSRKIVSAEEDWLDQYVMPSPSFRLIFLDIPCCKCPEILSESFVPSVLERAACAFGMQGWPNESRRLNAAAEINHGPSDELSNGSLSAQRKVQDEQASEIGRNLRVENASSFQVKQIPWHALKLDEDHSRELVIESSRRLPMVVCASLLDRTPNIAGLTRTAEVFGLQSLAIPDLAVQSTKEYTSIAVTAERWIKTICVPPASLAEWLLQMKEDGYSLVGLEQSQDSVSLVDFVFPRRVVLVLGNELRGMPASYLSMLDYVVEIPQLGTIRSLNAHVSASVAIAQYVMQQIRQNSV